jgi:lipopolysaccharide export system protein LptA
MSRFQGVIAAAIATAAALATVDASAQGGQGKGPATPLKALSQGNDKPIKIKSATLEVRDKDRIATFSGDVQASQGDVTLRCKVLVVYYEGEAAKTGAPPAAQSGQGGQQVRRMVAKGGIMLTQKDQTATADTGDFDVRANTVALTGNVVVTQGQSVMRGQRLIVNLTTGVSRMESSGGTPLEMLIEPKSNPDLKRAPMQPPRPGRPN